MKQKIKVWDMPVRLFHWSLPPAMLFMWFSAEQGGSWLQWHLRCGLFILFLLVFRICWGLWGSETARFSRFVRPGQILPYLQGRFDENRQPGHNPLGALMVLALIGGLLLQVVTGLFSPDENTWLNNGYLHAWAGEEWGGRLRSLHFGWFNVLIGLIAVHIATVLLYRWVKRKDLIRPMISGYKTLDQDAVRPVFAGTVRLAAALAVAAAAVAAVLLAA